MIVLVQIGFKKSWKESQYIEAYKVEGLYKEKVTWKKLDAGYCEGEFVSALSERFKSTIYIAKVDIVDSLIIKVSTYLKGLGMDELRSFVSVYKLSDVMIKEVIKGVGDPKFPLIQGNVKLVGSRSLRDERLDRVWELYNEIVGEGRL
jgi:hypothetical protein